MLFSGRDRAGNGFRSDRVAVDTFDIIRRRAGGWFFFCTARALYFRAKTGKNRKKRTFRAAVEFFVYRFASVRGTNLRRVIRDIRSAVAAYQSAVHGNERPDVKSTGVLPFRTLTERGRRSGVAYTREAVRFTDLLFCRSGRA